MCCPLRARVVTAPFPSQDSVGPDGALAELTRETREHPLQPRSPCQRYPYSNERRRGRMGIRVGMVGVGAFARHFIPLFQAHPSVDEVALCDLDAAKLQDAAATYGIS